MRLLLGSGGFFATPESGAHLKREIDQFLGDAVTEVLIVPFAQIDQERVFRSSEKQGLFGRRKMKNLAAEKNAVEAVRGAQAITVFGGNTFLLLNELYQLDLLEVIRERVRGGMPYVGMSAGINITAPTIMTTNDMPIVQPPSFKALGLVPFQINPHYFSGKVLFRNPKGEITEYAGETRDDRLNEFHAVNETPIMALPEATVLKVEGKVATYFALDAGAPARVFLKGKPPQDFADGSDLSRFL